MIQSEFVLVILSVMSVASEWQSSTLLRRFVSEVKFLNESYCMSCTNCLLVMMVVTDVVRVPVGVKAMMVTVSMCIRKKRTWHLFGDRFVARYRRNRPVLAYVSDIVLDQV